MQSSGFTLIELLVVIGIISLLSSTVLVSIQDARQRARYASATQEMKSIAQAVLQYELKNGEWPNDVGSGVPPEFVPEQLSSWPDPQCGEYDYENWSGYGANPSDPDIRISLRGTKNGPFWYCVMHERIGDCKKNNNVYVGGQASGFSSIHSVNSIEC